MSRIHCVGLGTLGLALAILAGQPESSFAQVGEKLSTVPVAQVAAATPPTVTSVKTIRLQADGNLAGQVNGAGGPNGAFQGAQISIVKNGQIVASTRTDESGHFQLVGVQPGTYSLIANGPTGAAAFEIQVLPVTGGVNGAAGVADAGTLLDVDLIPMSDFNLLMQAMGATPAGTPGIPTAGTPAPAPAGGGGGGAGGLGAALGAGAAAAGLAGGAAGGAGGAPASPSTP
jgi:hypothetical protein